jgi:hypothetical protein
MVRSIVIQSMPMDRARSLTCVNDLTVLVRGLRLIHCFRPAPEFMREFYLPPDWTFIPYQVAQRHLSYSLGLDQLAPSVVPPCGIDA